jgi:hypothetical protein
MKNQWEKAGIAPGVLYHPPDVPLPKQRTAMAVASGPW